MVYKNLYIFYTSSDSGNMKGIIPEKTYLIHVNQLPIQILWKGLIVGENICDCSFFIFHFYLILLLKLLFILANVQLIIPAASEIDATVNLKKVRVESGYSPEKKQIRGDQEHSAENNGPKKYVQKNN